MVNWPEIVEQHGPCVWRTAYRLLSDREEANDCYQETFLQAVTYSKKREVTNWFGLLKQIATAKALDRLRRRYRSRSQELEHSEAVIGHELAPDQRMEQAEWMESLREAVAELPEQHANVFWLCEVEKMKHSEVATQLEINPQQVANWLHRAKQKLRQLLQDKGIADEVKQ